MPMPLTASVNQSRHGIVAPVMLSLAVLVAVLVAVLFAVLVVVLLMTGRFLALMRETPAPLP